MSVKSAMDATFAVNVTTQSVQEFWSRCHTLKASLDDTLTRLNAIAADPKNNFAGVDPVIVAEGGAILNILVAAQTALNAHLEFINWNWQG